MGDNAAAKKQMNQTITAKTKEMKDCEQIRQKLNQEKASLERYRSRWEKQYQSHQNSKVAKQVVIKNVLEGKVADKLKGYYGDQVANMHKTSDKIEKLCKELDSQVRRLNTHISGLQSDIKTTQSKLNNMEE